MILVLERNQVLLLKEMAYMVAGLAVLSELGTSNKGKNVTRATEAQSRIEEPVKHIL